MKAVARRARRRPVGPGAALGLVAVLSLPGAALATSSEPGEACATPKRADAGEEEPLVLVHELGAGRRLCVRADPGVQLDERDGSLRHLPEGRSLAIAIVGERGICELRVRAEAGGARYDWSVNGATRPFDASARGWMEDALEAAAGLREIASIRAEARRLEREIDSVRSRERELRDEIGAILAERGRLERKIGTIRAQETELRDGIAQVQGAESALRVALGAQRAAVADLSARLEEADASRREELERELERRHASIGELEARLRSENHAGQIEALEQRLAGLKTGERVAGIEARVAALEVDERVAEIETLSRSLQPRERIAALRRRLDTLDADARVARIESRLEPLLRRLAREPGGG